VDNALDRNLEIRVFFAAIASVPNSMRPRRVGSGTVVAVNVHVTGLVTASVPALVLIDPNCSRTAWSDVMGPIGLLRL
jgi:hypothetical protein